MTPLDHYEILLRSRRALMDRVRPLSLEQYRQQFPFGLKSVGATLTHLADAEWIYARRVRGEEIQGDRPFTETRYPDFASLEPAWKALEADTRAWLGSESDWQRRIEVVLRPADRKPIRVVYTPEQVAAQMCYHEVHHRAQVMAMLRQLGIAVENLDFSRHAYEWTELT